MNAMTAVAAVPAFALSEPVHARFVPLGSRSAWDRAAARVQELQAEYDRVNPQHSAAFDAAEAECPREEVFFRRYKLGCNFSREENLRAAHQAVVLERVCVLGRSLRNGKEAAEAREEAIRIVDRFDDWRKRYTKAHERHDCDAWEERYNAVVDRRYEAQDALIAMKAPDHAAVLLKLEILAERMDGEDSQEYVEAVRDDMRRLTGAATH
jgi:hypothetical protein